MFLFVRFFRGLWFLNVGFWIIIDLFFQVKADKAFTLPLYGLAKRFNHPDLRFDRKTAEHFFFLLIAMEFLEIKSKTCRISSDDGVCCGVAMEYVTCGRRKTFPQELFISFDVGNVSNDQGNLPTTSRKRHGEERIIQESAKRLK